LACTSDPAVTLSGTPVGGTFTGTGVSGNLFDPSISGTGTFTITYTYSDLNTCPATASQTVDVSTCTGIKEASNGNSFVIFPNPTSGNFYIDFKSNTIDNASVEVYDAIGKLVLTEKINTSLISISLDQYTKGIYSVRIKNNGTYHVTRIIKE
jgi:hypothetical protein